MATIALIVALLGVVAVSITMMESIARSFQDDLD